MSFDKSMPSQAEQERIRELATACNDVIPSVDPELRKLTIKEIDEWETRRESLDPDDPIYEAVEDELADLRERREELLEKEPDAYYTFLESVAEQFVVAGFWLDKQILEALNRTLFGKYGETLVIDGRVIKPESTFEDNGSLYEISMAIRKMAQSVLRHRDL